MNVYESNLFHTKMMLRDIDLENYMFTSDINSYNPSEQADIYNLVHHEMIEIFNGRNIYNKEDES